jgi:hypothetical protein
MSAARELTRSSAQQSWDDGDALERAARDETS